ncbi:MAG: DedA family protein [Chloroflexi bacterium]|nr:MAG: DedA family protein [Chloroflexota bacterium]
MGLGTLLDAITAWAKHIVSTMGYLGLVFVMFLENVFPPIPSEVILPLAGSLALEGRFTLFGVTVMGTIGSVMGALFFYQAGHLLGEGRVRQLIALYGKWLLLSVKDFDKAVAWFDRYGEAVIFFGRMVPIVRSLVSIPAGVARMNYGKFIAYTAVGTGMWSFLLTYAGYLLGQQWHLVSEWVSRYENFVIVAVVVLILAFIVKRLWNWRLAAQQNTA